jgi:hypothetical protein
MPEDAPDTGTDDTTPDEPDQPDDTKPDKGDDEPDWKVEADKWKKLARKHEGRARDNAKAVKELDELKSSQMSETEKAVKEAEERGRRAATTEVAQRLAGAKIEAVLTGIVPDPAAFVEDLNLAKYVTEDGDVDLDAVNALREKYEALAPKDTPSNGARRPKERLGSVPLPNSDQIQIDDETDPRKLAARIRRV